MLSSDLLKKIERIYLKSKFLANDVFAGEYKTAFRGRGIEFDEFRDYTPGDDVRLIDWNVSARMDRLFIKRYHEEREQTVVLLIDCSKSQSFGSQKRLKKEVVAEIAAVLAYAAIKENDKVGAILFTDQVERFIPPKKGKSHVWRVISEIMSFKPQGTKTNLTEALTYLGKVISRRSICFLISDFLDKNYQKSLRTLGFKHDLVSLLVLDPLEKKLPQGGWASLVDAETGQTAIIDFKNIKQRHLFQKQRQKHLEEMAKEFQSHNLDLLVLDSTQDYIESLLKFFRIREKRF